MSTFDPDDFERAPSAEPHANAIRLLAAGATHADGVAPFNDDSLVRLDERSLIAVRGSDVSFAAAALSHPVDGGLEAELVVHPIARHHGLGTALLEALIAEAPDGALQVWAHGDLPEARRLAEASGLRESRVLRKLGRDIADDDVDGGAAPECIELQAFRPGTDDGEFLALNARVFRDHPEQGALDHAGLKARMEQAWFRAEDFLLARDAATGTLLGYNWLKIADDEGEIYVIGVADEAAGRGLGRALMRAGLARIHAAGVQRTTLYVEGDNARALALYRSLGYSDDAIDVQYRTRAFG